MAKRGAGETIKFKDITHERLKQELERLLGDPSYAENMKELSRAFRDQKESPLERAIWWIEWALRNPNANYMKSPVLELGYIVGNAYDVIIFLTVIVLLSSLLFYKLLKFSLRVITRSSGRSSVSKVKKQN